MLTNDILVEGFGRIGSIVYRAVDGLSEEQLSFRSEGQGNSIAWLVWHLARIQDAQIADAAGTEQIWTAAGWHDKFNLPFDEDATGYGFSSDEVSQVKATAQLLTGYYDAVYAVTEKYLQSLKEEDYQRIVDESYDPPVTLLVRLVSILSDDLQHAGQAAYARGLLK